MNQKTAVKKVLPKEKSIDERYADAYFLYETGYFEKALQEFFPLVLLQPLNKTYWFALSSCWQMQKNYLQAIEGWKMTSSLDDQNPYPYFHLAECYLSINDAKKACMALQEAEKRFPQEELENKIKILKQLWNHHDR